MGWHISEVENCRHCPLRDAEQCKADIPQFRKVPGVQRGGHIQAPPPEWCPLRKGMQKIEVRLAHRPANEVDGGDGS